MKGRRVIRLAATTEGCTFLLDEDGVCLRVLLKGERRGTADTTLGGRTRGQAARRCIGAQYVASIDVRVEGGLVPMPRVGVPMLFAYTGEDGRIAVVRTGRLVRFETVEQGERAARGPRDDIPVDWDEDDDGCQTIPLHESGERRTPTVPLRRPGADTLRDPWVPPPRSSWGSLPGHVPVRLQKVNVVGPRESAPTVKRVTAPAGRGCCRRRPGACSRTPTLPGLQFPLVPKQSP